MVYTQALIQKLNNALVIDWSIEWSYRDSSEWKPNSEIITTWFEREAGTYTLFGFVGLSDIFGGIDPDNRHDHVLEQGITDLMTLYKRAMALETRWKSEYPSYIIT